MTQSQLAKAAFIRGADFAALYLGQNIPLHLIEEAFEIWLAEQPSNEQNRLQPGQP
jgi:hypothetical protein